MVDLAYRGEVNHIFLCTSVIRLECKCHHYSTRHSIHSPLKYEQDCLYLFMRYTVALYLLKETMKTLLSEIEESAIDLK